MSTNFNKLALVVFFVISTIMFISCKKTLLIDTSSENDTNVTFKVAGVNSEVNHSKIEAKKASSRIETNSIKSNSSVRINKLQPNISLDTINSIEAIETSFGNYNSRLGDDFDLGSKVLNKMAASTPMASGRKYRIVILDLNNNIVKTVQSSVDKSININLELGQQYKWYAYSYDDDSDIPAPSSTQTIETPTDRDLLYAKSSIPFTVVPGENPISVLFEHQLAMLSIELDYDRLFATIPTNDNSSTSVSNNFNWTFVSQPNFLYKGTFSLTTGEVSNQQAYSVDINEIVKDHPSSDNIKVAQCYIVPPPDGVTVSNSFTVSLNTLNVKFPNSTTNVEVITEPVTNIFSSLSSVKGEKYVAKFKLWYTFKKLNILHVTRGNDYAYAAQPKDLSEGAGMDAIHPDPDPKKHHTSYNMIKEPRNFGLLSNSVVRTNGFGHRRLSHNFRIDTALHLGSNPTIPPPDIVIIATYYQMSDSDTQALVNYVNRGGVLFLMSDGVNDSDYQSHRLFFQRLFSNPATTSNKSGFSGGSVYKLADIDDEILNGPFGDIRNKHWGEDATATIALENFPTTDVTEYSKSVPINVGSTASIGATMIKHNSKHFFWVGDGGFIACDEVSGAHGSPANPATGSWASWANQPFATATSPTATTRRHPYPYLSTDYEFFPVPRKFGYSGNGYLTNSLDVYNSTVFANFMSWAVKNATFSGINNGGL